MAVLRRAEEVHDTHVATSTVVGMVLGVLSLFSLVVAYQFFPRRRPARSNSLSQLAPPPRKPRPLLARLRTLLTAPFRRSPAEPSHSRRHALRSFHLTPARRRERDATRRKFAGALKLDIPPLSNPFSNPFAKTPLSSPRRPTRAYARMKDDDAQYDALLRSPDSESPTTPPPCFKPLASPLSPPPLYPPPPAYVPRTPLRGGVAAFGDPFADPPADPFVDPAGDVYGDAEREKRLSERMAEADRLMAEIQGLIERGARRASAFVVADSDDEDVGSLSECSI
ncbi:hypothetical protein PsYK624_087900 [Phanerochaete sordida]|uniref:Uncharacterized protein n=1 Tax=Phanerochaete sordida TaxID=48140 RepID=A0A9P3LEU8_9APHY|nr:hypothetical protein PsYK624_087900 [Phanerochaete sordida]